MLSRCEREKIKRSKRNMKMKSLFFKCINLLSKTYLYLGFAVVLMVSVVSIVYKSYWHQEPPLNYQRYIYSNKELEMVLTSVITSFFISGVIALFTEQKNNSALKNVDQEIDKKVRSKRSFRKAG